MASPDFPDARDYRSYDRTNGGAASPNYANKPPTPGIFRKSQSAPMADSSMLAGVGCYFTHESDSFHVQQLTPGGSTARTGAVHVGDRLVEIDGVSTRGWSTDDLKNAILGEAGTMVELTFVRHDDEFRVTTMRGTPPWLSLNDRYESQRKQLIAQSKENATLRVSLAKTESETMKLTSEVSRMKARVDAADEELPKVRTEALQEARRTRAAESASDRLLAQSRLDAEEIARLKQTISSLEEGLKKFCALAEDNADAARAAEARAQLENDHRVKADTVAAEAREAASKALSERQNAESARDGLATKLSDTERDARALAKELQAATTRADTAEKDAAAAHARANDLELNLSAETRQRVAAETACEQCGTQIATLEADVKRLVEQNENGQRLLQEQGTQALAQRAEDGAKHQAEMQERQAMHSKQMSAQQALLQEAQNDHAAEMKDIQAKHNKATKEATAAAKKAAEAMHAQIKDVQGKLRSTTSAHQEAVSRCEDLQSDIRRMTAAVDAGKAEVERANVARADAEGQADAERRKRTATEQLLANAEAEAERLVGEKATVQTELHDQKVQTKDAQAQKTQQEKYTQAAKKELKETADALAEASSKAASLEAENGGLKVEQERLIKEIVQIDELKARIDQLQQRVLAVEEERFQAQTAMTKAKEELAAFYRLPDPCGIGMQVETDGSKVVVKSLLGDGSAMRSGALAPGDTILSIDGVSMAGKSSADVREAITGRRGTYVSLTVQHEGEAPVDVDLRRGNYATEHHIVGTERIDGPVEGQSSQPPGVPERPGSGAYTSPNGEPRRSQTPKMNSGFFGF